MINRKRTITFLLCLAMVLGSAGCKKNSKDSGAVSDGSISDGSGSEVATSDRSGTSSKVERSSVISETDPFFDVTDIELQLPGTGEKTLTSVDIDRDNIRFVGNIISATQCHFAYEMPQDVREKIKLLENSGENEEAGKLRSEYDVFCNCTFSLDGKILSVSEGDARFQENNIITAFEGPQGEIYAITACGEDCFLSRMKADGTLETVWPITSGWVQDAVMLPDGSLVCASFEGVTILDANGDQKGNFRADAFAGKVYYQDGTCYGEFVCYDGDTFEDYLKEIDIQKCQFVGDKIPSQTNGVLIKSEDGIYSYSQNGLLKMDITDPSESEEIFSWSDTDYNPKSLLPQSAKVVSDREFCFLSLIDDPSDPYSYNVRPHIVRAVRADKNPYAGRKHLSVGVFLNAMDVDAVIRYNTDPNSESRVTVHEYTADMAQNGTYMNQEADMSDRVYLDIISGTGPDMLVGFSRYAHFNSDDVLVDLNPMIDATDGTGLDRSRYFDNVIRAQEAGGKLYQLPVEFELYGLLGNKSLVGEAKPRSYDEFIQEMDALPEDVSVMYATDDKEFLELFLGECGENFVDYSEQKVHFDSDEFKKCLEIVKKYGIHKTDRSEIFRDDMSLFQEGKLAWYSLYMYNLRDYGYWFEQYGDGITFSGFPGNNGNGIVANVRMSIGITSCSENKEEAWDFIRYILANSEDRDSSGSVPLSREALDRRNEKFIKQSEGQLNGDSSGMDGYSGPPPVKLTSDMAKEFVSIVESVTTVRKSDPAVLLIIYEEAPAYFLDQKSVDAVADIIQSRCKVIVQERG